MRADLQDIRSLLRGVADERVVEAMVARAQPAIELSPRAAADASIPVGGSKFGGAADLPREFTWPEGIKQPMAFLAQIDLAAASGFDRSGLLPREGLLSFFYAYDQGLDESPTAARGFHIEHTHAGVALERRQTPAGTMSKYVRETEHPSCPVVHRSIMSVPSLAELTSRNAGELMAEDEIRDACELIWGPQGDATTSLHQLLGHTYPVQNSDILIEASVASQPPYRGLSESYAAELAQAARREAGDWMLLLQLDTDDRTSWMWGDMGMVYFVIRREDLARLDYSRAWCVTQCG